MENAPRLRQEDACGGQPSPRRKGLGYAEESVELLAEAARSAGFSRIRLGVSLGNWPALRFWHRMGFDKVAGFVGDKLPADGASASIVLERMLDRGLAPESR